MSYKNNYYNNTGDQLPPTKTNIMTIEFKQSHLDLIIRCKGNLLDLLNEGVLSIETVNEYISLLDAKFDEIYNFLNTHK